nr:2-phospho-L-lactate transferase [Anaerolineae bacterium]
MNIRKNVVILVGGVGGAKMAVGLANILPPDALTVIVNTADDFEHLGLHISPDVDTLMYSLSGLVNPSTGWGLEGDTFQAMEQIRKYGGPDWFNLGDCDLGTHLVRTHLLNRGLTLTEITQYLCSRLGIKQHLLPMTNDQVKTILDTDQGELGFQEYFVRERWLPAVHGIRFEGSSTAAPSPEAALALETASLIILGTSNPFLSIDPIISIQGISERILKATVPRIAISPVIAGKAIKGPTVKLMTELGVEPSPVGVAEHYQNLLDGFILDKQDAALCDKVEGLGLRTAAFQTYMASLADKITLARQIINWVEDSFG